MLFQSHLFILILLLLIPMIAKIKDPYPKLYVPLLLFISCAFYASHALVFLPLLVALILFNYFISSQPNNKIYFAVAIMINISTLLFYKYFSTKLPLGLSFYTFLQIAYLVQVRQAKYPRPKLAEYALMVGFFPTIQAGPIVNPQRFLADLKNNYKINYLPFIYLFAIGLFKKLCLADPIATYANPVFSAAASGVAPSFFESWVGVLAYTFQLYFDFSAYSDMAIAIAGLLGLQIPANFNSPYQATSIIEFWRRWHISLSSWLRDYVYIPLGGSRHGTSRKYLALFLTMLIGGIWHGNTSNFVIWGMLHGLYLIINHSYLKIKPNWKPLGGIGGGLLTFLAVMFSWIFFRSDNFDSACNIVAGMLGQHGFFQPEIYAERKHWLVTTLSSWGVVFKSDYVGESLINSLRWILFAASVIWLAPNSQYLAQLAAKHKISALLLGAWLFIYLAKYFNYMPSEFLYVHF